MFKVLGAQRIQAMQLHSLQDVQGGILATVKGIGCGGAIVAAIALAFLWNVATGGTNQNSSQLQPTTKVTIKANPDSENSGCPAIRAELAIVRNEFAAGTASPARMSAVLNAAAEKWSSIASNNTGSRADWLNKMADLSRDLDNYIMTGSPANGDVLFDQLQTWMNLEGNFCWNE